MKNWSGGYAFPIVVLLALVLLTAWLRYLVDKPEPLGDGRFRHDPDYIIEDFRASRLSPQGETRHTLAAERLLHYPDTDETLVVEPRLLHILADGSAVDVEARRAAISRNGEIIQLNEQVVLRRPGAGGSELRIATEALTVIPDTGIVTGAARVVADDGRANLAGTGFTADLNARSFVLHSAATARFPPP